MIKVIRFVVVCLMILNPLLLKAADVAVHQTYIPVAPWFTGPLLAPSGYTTPPGHYNVQPYLYYTVDTGQYDQHWHTSSTSHFNSVSLEVQTKFGILSRLDFTISPKAFYQETQGQHTINVGDIPFGFGVQLLPAKITDPWPAIKLSLRANIPTGKYQKFNPDKLRTDAMGTGSWLPGVGLTFAKLWDLGANHFIEGRLGLNYQVGTPVHVKGFNTYGGGYGTDGTAYHGNIFWVDGSIQYNLTQNWALACDLFYNHRKHDRFSGNPGTLNGEKASVTRPTSDQLSLAPAIEYNFSKNVGIIGGVWFTFAGQNASRFISGVISVNIFI